MGWYIWSKQFEKWTCVPEAGMTDRENNNYTPQYLQDEITYSCPWHLLLTHESTNGNGKLPFRYWSRDPCHTRSQIQLKISYITYINPVITTKSCYTLVECATSCCDLLRLNYSNTDFPLNWDMPISQIPHCIRQIAYNTQCFVNICAHVHISVTKWCILRYGSGAFNWGKVHRESARKLSWTCV